MFSGYKAGSPRIPSHCVNFNLVFGFYLYMAVVAGSNGHMAQYL